ncbi:hypothetical protein COCON_G00149410 [Conger conger]|uniref:Immunoglobulin subtype domain-containing protein n=1 Tax=Conger conger TaxID=82655 RepID=A0A9Q1DCD9_CONCO|nr:hypothetical protein COCON_G00149410 [Conger conger]
MCLLTMDPAIFILLLFLGHLSRGQYRADTSGAVLLQLPFNPYFNNYEKGCCKFYPDVCVPVVDNRRYCADLYKGRISINEYSGLMVVRIWNLQKSDAGLYRCAVTQSPYHIYMDFSVEIRDSANRQSPPLPSLMSTARPATVSVDTTSVTPVESPNESQSNGSLRFKTDMWILLAAALSLLLMLILIISVTIAVHHRKKYKEKSGTAPCDSSSSSISGSTSQDVNAIVYTTVNFKTCEEPTGLYANLNVQKSSAARCPQSYGHHDSGETVEYSTLAVRQK